MKAVLYNNPKVKPNRLYNVKTELALRSIKNI